jgi:DNA-binding GntR family transcriptional regulator
MEGHRGASTVRHIGLDAGGPAVFPQPCGDAMTGGTLRSLKSRDTRLAPRAYERLLALILSGELGPGDVVNERRLADVLGMSRTPVRDALLMLETEGLVERQGNRGLQVRQMRIENYMEALQVRALLEPQTARMAAQHGRGLDWGALVARLDRLMATPAQEVDRGEVRAIDDQLHGMISEASGNRQLSSIILTLRRQTQIFDLKSVPERLEDTCREHLEIIAHVREGDGERAADAMRKHLDGVRDSIIRCLSGV